ncbi:uncharacterized protein LOC141646878 [Silene latifolia]|uniref:uncharacterized protein LOC141646878 n=1 Tax=Silene latifolia TaxID=37657 RepID=UPI003D771C74
MAKKSSKTSTITEEKEEIMVDHTSSSITQNPTKRTGYFLKPTLNSNALPPKLPKIQSFSSLSKLNVLFQFNSTPLKGWKTWVENLQKTHESAWRKAGIFDAIKCSTYHIAKDSDLILNLVEKWCPETNTFVFPWGEATVTLEDVYVLGGFSPLGVSVCNSSSLGNNVVQVENKLIESYRKLTKKRHNLSHLRWQEHFMRHGGEIEYAGFLSLWLVRYVFPDKNISRVTQTVFPIAARISCGAKFALGPAILASLYRNLTVLKKEIVDNLRGRCRDGGALIVKLSSPFHLVQVWAWERFPSLGRVPRMIDCGEVRLVRWESRVRKVCDRLADIKICLDSARETFRWRPYGMSIENWSLPKFYVESGTWVVVNSDEDWKLIARCLMVGQLEGLGFVERYNPHRVALQFGFDQDIPKSFDGSKAKNSKGLKLYLPPRLHEGDVTYRYFDWWRTMLNVDEGVRVGCKRKTKTSKRAKKMAKICDNIAENVRGESLNKSRHMEESAQNLLQVGNDIDMISEEGTVVLEDVETEVWTDNYSVGEGKSLHRSPHMEEYSQNLLQVGNDINMTSVFHMEIGLNSPEDTVVLEDEETEVWTDNHSVGEGSNNFHGEEMDNEMNIACSKLAETEPNGSVDQEEGNTKLSEMLLVKKENCDAMNSVCLQVAAENQNLGNEVGQLKVMSPLIAPEGGSGKSEDGAREQNKEQNLAEHNVEMDKSSECLAANIPQIEEFSQIVPRVSNDIEMACVFHMEVGLNSQEDSRMEEDRQNELWMNNHCVGEGSNNSDRSNFNKEEKENETNISCSKLVEVEPNRSLDQEEGDMKRSEILLKRTQECDAMNSLSSEIAIKHQILGNEIGQVMVRCPLIRPEEGLRMSEDIHDLKMDKSLECLAANIPKIEPTESERTLIKVACEDEPARALCQGPNQDTNHDSITPFNSQVIVIDDDDDDDDNYDYNKFQALCLEYESRVSRLEKLIFALSASKRRRLTITG